MLKKFFNFLYYILSQELESESVHFKCPESDKIYQLHNTGLKVGQIQVSFLLVPCILVSIFCFRLQVIQYNSWSFDSIRHTIPKVQIPGSNIWLQSLGLCYNVVTYLSIKQHLYLSISFMNKTISQLGHLTQFMNFNKNICCKGSISRLKILSPKPGSLDLCSNSLFI